MSNEPQNLPTSFTNAPSGSPGTTGRTISYTVTVTEKNLIHAKGFSWLWWIPMYDLFSMHGRFLTDTLLTQRKLQHRVYYKGNSNE